MSSYAVEREDDEEHPIGVVGCVREDDALVFGRPTPTRIKIARAR